MTIEELETTFINWLGTLGDLASWPAWTLIPIVGTTIAATILIAKAIDND